ncbi:hypothetical protein PENTCL1PPCAC_30193, partial [Pristionchus entomophagus]
NSLPSSTCSIPCSSPHYLIRVSCAKLIEMKRRNREGRLRNTLLIVNLHMKAKAGTNESTASRRWKQRPLEQYANDENDGSTDTEVLSASGGCIEATEESTISTMSHSSADRKRSSTTSCSGSYKRFIPSYLRPLTAEA